jgi:dynactin 1
MRGKLSHFSLLNRRFAAYLKRCSVEKYAKTGGIYHELAGVERRIDGYLELLKKDEFREFDCVADLTKSVISTPTPPHLSGPHR